jgi:hypothetical protein
MKILGFYNERESLDVQLKKFKNMNDAEWKEQIGGIRLKKQ